MALMTGLKFWWPPLEGQFENGRYQNDASDHQRDFLIKIGHVIHHWKEKKYIEELLKRH